MSNIAYCGLNCDACCFRVAALERDMRHLENIPERYRRLTPAAIEEMEVCSGCKPGGRCGPCTMRDCAAEKGFSTCAECAEMPCEKLLAFSCDGAPHHAAVIVNLARIREIGEEAWAVEQEESWKCPACGARLSWYHTQCPECKED